MLHGCIIISLQQGFVIHRAIIAICTIFGEAIIVALTPRIGGPRVFIFSLGFTPSYMIAFFLGCCCTYIKGRPFHGQTQIHILGLDIDSVGDIYRIAEYDISTGLFGRIVDDKQRLTVQDKQERICIHHLPIGNTVNTSYGIGIQSFSITPQDLIHLPQTTQACENEENICQ